MQDLLTAALTTLVNNSPVVACLLVGIYHFKKSDDRKDTKIEALIKGWNEERSERIDILEEHVTDCNARHAAVQLKYEQILMRVARLDEIEHKQHPGIERSGHITKRVVLPTRRTPGDGQA